MVGGAAIVLPYLVPFLFGLALLEDIGYLPRVAYLMDGLLHRIGLHGTSMLPLILGYGCSVPACMAARILPSRRDRFIATRAGDFDPVFRTVERDLRAGGVLSRAMVGTGGLSF